MGVRAGLLATVLALAVGGGAAGCATRPFRGSGLHDPGCPAARACAPASQALPPCPACPPPAHHAHGSAQAFLATHLSPDLWAARVLPDYLSRPDAVVPVVLGGAALLAGPFDHRIERAISGSLGKAELVGDLGANGLPVAALALGLLCPREGRSALDVTWSQAEALVLTIGATEGLKALVGRHRPEGSRDTASFPSGHTAMAFCAATLIGRNCGPRIGLLAYGVAAATGLSRIEAGRHFPSDVLAGAALGTLLAGLVDALHFGDGVHGGGICGTRLAPEIGPVAEGGFGVGVSLGL